MAGTCDRGDLPLRESKTQNKGCGNIRIRFNEVMAMLVSFFNSVPSLNIAYQLRINSTNNTMGMYFIVEPNLYKTNTPKLMSTIKYKMYCPIIPKILNMLISL